MEETKTAASHLLIKTCKAICKLLYTLTKIRGEKVIVRFFGAETRHVELLVSAVEKAELEEPVKGKMTVEDVLDEREMADNRWSWEERYICLLWLSHFLLVPFDLSTISSSGTENVKHAEIHGLELPPNVPGLTLRVLPLAFKYLGSAGKERDAAKALLVRISMRRDMQELGLLDALIQWAMTSLKSSSSASSGTSSPYYYIGILSYLAGTLSASLSTSDLDPYLLKVFRCVQNVSDQENAAFKTVHTSATARKTVIKVLRTISVLVLRKEYIAKGSEVLTTEIVETTIGHLFDALADNDTPVRLAASKALSVITFKLAPYQAEDVVEAVLESFESNVLSSKSEDGSLSRRDLSAVNPQEWHGLMLTLSHLLYRKSPPISMLAPILAYLLEGLNFEQRSTSGSSVGTNVRDAACFGIWAVARRYTTSELKSVKLDDEDAEGGVIQHLATHLVCAASLDSAGNIRRGASAALQELIGRHPDVVTEGIPLVQVVDYYAVALRSKAILEVGLAASKLGTVYEKALTTAVLGWRGVGDGDRGNRRVAATAMGRIAGCAMQKHLREFPESVNGLWEPGDERLPVWTTFANIHSLILGLKVREVDRRHGLLLCLASLVNAYVASYREERLEGEKASPRRPPNPTESSFLVTILQQLDTHSSPAVAFRRPELVLEGTCRLSSAGVSLLSLLSKTSDAGKVQRKASIVSREFSKVLLSALEQTGKEVLEAACGLAVNMCSHPELDFQMAGRTLPGVKYPFAPDPSRGSGEAMQDGDDEKAEPFAGRLADTLIQRLLTATVALARQPGYLLALGHIALSTSSTTDFETRRDTSPNALQSNVARTILVQWAAAKNVESRIIVLRALHEPLHSVFDANSDVGGSFCEIVAEALDDYTTDSRGDIGSLVRAEALKVATKIFGSKLGRSASVHVFRRTLRLAAEKLDRVRVFAQRALAILAADSVRPEDTKIYSLDAGTEEYFLYLLSTQVSARPCGLNASSGYAENGPEGVYKDFMPDLLTGLVTSADAGSESLVRASRAALEGFCHDRAPPSPDSCTSTTYQSGVNATRNTGLVATALMQVLRGSMGNDRILIPALEIVAFLFDSGVMAHPVVNYKTIFILTQKAHYKSGSVRKLETATRIYGGLMGDWCGLYSASLSSEPLSIGKLVDRSEASRETEHREMTENWGPKQEEEVVTKLTSMLLHPFVAVRGAAVDALFIATGWGKGVDWGKAGKRDVEQLRVKLRRRMPVHLLEGVGEEGRGGDGAENGERIFKAVSVV